MAELFYEEATVADSTNGFLFDRYAYFLLSAKNRPDQALEKSVAATALESGDKDIWFTRGLIEARLGMRIESLMSLERSEKLGKPRHLVSLQRAYAFVKNKSPDWRRAMESLQDARRLTPIDDPYRLKHLSEVNRLQNRVETQADW